MHNRLQSGQRDLPAHPSFFLAPTTPDWVFLDGESPDSKNPRMPGGPPSFDKLWEQLNDEAPLPHETKKEFRRRIEKQIHLLERLAEEWEVQRKRLGSGAIHELEQELFASARAGLERIRRNGEADAYLRRRREGRSRSSDD